MSDDAAPTADAPPAASATPAERVRPVHVVPGPSASATTGVPAFVAAVQARDGAALRAAIAPTFVGRANGRTMDRDAQVALVEAFWNGFPDTPLAMEATGGSGHYVITWKLEGPHNGMYLGVPPTGRLVKLDGFIVARADGTGVKALDWKWDTKAFARAVLGPDDVGDLEVKDRHRPDPSRRWHEGQRRSDGRKKGPRQGQPGQAAQPGQGAPPAPQSGQQARQPGERRQRKPRQPRADAPTPAGDAGSVTPEGGAAATPEATEAPAPAPPTEEATPKPAPDKPEGT